MGGQWTGKSLPSSDAVKINDVRYKLGVGAKTHNYILVLNILLCSNIRLMKVYLDVNFRSVLDFIFI